MMKYLLYGHGGSGNHGCEAIIRSTLKMLDSKDVVEVYSSDLANDKKYGITEKAIFYPCKDRHNAKFSYLISRAIYKFTGYADFLNLVVLSDALQVKDAVCLSVGGDNYCNKEPGRHASRNKLFSKHNKTVLWGCSVTPALLRDPKYIEDMKRYDLITARESLTYNALVDAGVKNARLVSDPAFTLELKEVELPELFMDRKIVGINVSPLVMKYQQGANTLIKNIQVLMKYLLEHTDYGIALIPHVRLKNNDDFTPLKQLFEEFKNSRRVCLIDEAATLNCCELKYIISKCNFMIAARTHASIAAYSTCVPTLVLGYSVKSLGIATDIFGVADNYVLPVDKIKENNEIQKAFVWLQDKETMIRDRYKTVMPSYIEKALLGKKYLQEL